MAEAVERIVVQTTVKEKRAIAAKAKRLGLPISELMRRGAFDYNSDEDKESLSALAEAAQGAAERAAAAIDDALAFVEASNKRIAARETKAVKRKAAYWGLPNARGAP
jgi:predicted DNA binding CopG/RHH family protein